MEDKSEPKIAEKDLKRKVIARLRKILNNETPMQWMPNEIHYLIEDLEKDDF